MALNEVLLWVVVVLFLKDPPPPKGKTFASEPATEATLQDIAKALMNFDILFPVIQQFVMSANYTLFGISLLPLASHMLGWTPVQISKLTALQSVVTFVGMLVMMYLSIRKTTDFTMLSVGNGIFVIAGVFTYAWWRMDTGSVIKFAFPIMVTALAFPFTGPANQSSFNRAVFSRPELASSIGVLQSLYAQGGTVAGIVAPIFVTAFVLRQPKDITLNSPFELTRLSWYVPISALFMIIGLLYEEFVLGKNELGLLPSKPEIEIEEVPTEKSKLMVQERSKSSRRSIVEINQALSRQCEVGRRMSSEILINGVGIINPCETAAEMELMKALSHDREEWVQLLKLDEEMDEVEMEG